VSTEDTLAQWLAWRYGHRNANRDGGWNDVSPEDQSYWEHEADAVRRAAQRGGWKRD
jgi:hypothetical protein